MLTEPQREHVGRVAATLQIIVGALAAGVVTFALVTLTVSFEAPAADPAESPIVSYVAVFFALLAVAMAAIVPAMISNRQQQGVAAGETVPGTRVTEHFPSTAELGDVAPLAGMFQTRVIVRSAILEGAALLNLVAYMLEGHLVCLVAAGVLALVMLSQFPTTSRLVNWVENERLAVEQLRQLETTDVG